MKFARLLGYDCGIKSSVVLRDGTNQIERLIGKRQFLGISFFESDVELLNVHKLPPIPFHKLCHSKELSNFCHSEERK